MKVKSFSHVGITVSDFGRAVRFYADVFGAPLVGVNDHGSDRVRSFFGVDGDDPALKLGWVRIPGGAVLEIFEFRPTGSPVALAWNRPGHTHICFNVHDTTQWHRYLVEKGVEIMTEPERSPKGHTFFFVKDPDGNLIELIDNKHMRAVLKWLGPLGGKVFRRSLYRRYYRAPLAGAGPR
jgi:catechol 2,3-dioxygenase-like lactoylglutathione lyase family enzyme